MNFYIYESDLFNNIKTHFDFSNNEFLKENNASIHRNYSHECNYFLNKILNLNCDNTKKYDFFIVPFVLKIKPSIQKNIDYKIFKKLICNLKYFEQFPERHVFFFVGDDWRVPELFERSALFMHSCH